MGSAPPTGVRKRSFADDRVLWCRGCMDGEVRTRRPGQPSDGDLPRTSTSAPAGPRGIRRSWLAVAATAILALGLVLGWLIPASGDKAPGSASVLHGQACGLLDASFVGAVDQETFTMAGPEIPELQAIAAQIQAAAAKDDAFAESRLIGNDLYASLRTLDLDLMNETLDELRLACGA